MIDRILTLMLMLSLFALCGCQGSSPSSPETNSAPNREVAGLYGGRVTLNGSVTTDPSYKNQPYTFTFPGKSGEIALLTMSATAIPATNHPVLVKFRGATTNYGSMLYPSDGTSNYLPLYLPVTENVTVTFYNTATAAPYPEAVTWNWNIRTRPAEDPREPNDDENTSTITDRNLATTLPLDQTGTYSMYRRVSVPSTQDREDWYRIEVPTSEQPLELDLTTSNGQWGSWRYDFRLYNASGQFAVDHLNVTATSDKWVTPPLAPGPYYLQVVGTPLSKRGSSVYYGQYTLGPRVFIAPGWQTYELVNRTPGHLALAIVDGVATLAWTTWAVTDFWSLHIAQATVPVPQSAADWTNYEIDPGVYRPTRVGLVGHGGRLWASAEGDIYQATSLRPASAADWSSYDLLFSGGELAVDAQGRLVLIGGANYAVARTPLPAVASDWSSHVVDSAIPFPHGLTYRNGAPALLGNTAGDGPTRHYWFLQALTPNPQSHLDWSKHALLTLDENIYAHSGSLTVANGRFLAVFAQQYSPQGPCCPEGSSHLYRALVDVPTSAADWEQQSAYFGDWVPSPSNFLQRKGDVYYIFNSDSTGDLEAWRVDLAAPLTMGVTSTIHPTLESRGASLVDLDGHLLTAAGMGSPQGLWIGYEVSGW